MKLEDLTVTELKTLAKDNGIEGVTKLKKDELIDLLSKENINLSNTIVNESINTTSENGQELGYKITNEDDKIIEGILEVLPDGYGFLRGENYLPRYN